MKLTRTWIDSQLNHSERTLLVDWLFERSGNPTGELIRAGLEELFPERGDYPSIQACLTWRNKVWSFEIAKRELAEDSQAARALAAAGNGSDLDEANRVMLQSMIFEQLRHMKEGRIESVDPEALKAMAKNVSVLARQGMAERELRVKLDAIATEKAANEAVIKSTLESGKRKGGLSSSEIADLERELKML